MHARFSWFAAVLSAAVPCQPVIVPSVRGTSPPATPTWSVLFSANVTTTTWEARTQSLYDVDDIGLPVAVFRALTTRRPAGFAYDCPAFTKNVTIQLAVGPIATGLTSRTFAVNLGPNAVTVFGPDLDAGQSIDRLVAGAVGRSGGLGTGVPVPPALGTLAGARHQTEPWHHCVVHRGIRPADGLGRGVRQPSEPTGVRLPRHRFIQRQADRRRLLVRDLRENAPGRVRHRLARSADAGSAWNGITLPVSLPGTPGCTWNVSNDVTLALVANAEGQATWPTTIPNNASRANQSFFTQALFGAPDVCVGARRLSSAA